MNMIKRMSIIEIDAIVNDLIKNIVSTIVNPTIEEVWDTNLKQHGVKLPKKSSKQREVLEILFENINKPLHIDTIKTILKERGFKLTGTDPVQTRHLSTQQGWYIEKTSKYEHMLVSVTDPLPGFIKSKRAVKVDDSIWKKLLEEYDHTCVNCGSKDNFTLRWKNTEITKLQQGHMDPRLPLTEDNCIPQCQFCNQRYKNKAVFDKRGQVIEFSKGGITGASQDISDNILD